jgi:hypothetical protein
MTKSEGRTLAQTNIEVRSFLTSKFTIQMFLIRLFFFLFEISSHSLKKAPVVFIWIRSEGF